LDGVAIQSAAQHGVAHDAAQDHQDAVAHRDADAGVSQFALQCDDPRGPDVADRRLAEARQQMVVEHVDVAGRA